MKTFKSRSPGIEIYRITVHCISFEDGIVLLADNEKEMEEMFNKLYLLNFFVRQNIKFVIYLFYYIKYNRFERVHIKYECQQN